MSIQANNIIPIMAQIHSACSHPRGGKRFYHCVMKWKCLLYMSKKDAAVQLQLTIGEIMSRPSQANAEHKSFWGSSLQFVQCQLKIIIITLKRTT